MGSTLAPQRTSGGDGLARTSMAFKLTLGVVANAGEIAAFAGIRRVRHNSMEHALGWHCRRPVEQSRHSRQETSMYQ